MDVLENIRRNIEERRRNFMRSSNEQRQGSLSQRQAELNQMIQEFMQRTGDSFDGSQIFQKLEEIGQSMKNAERKLGNSRLEGGIQYQQDALQKIGEMMEQLQQSQQPSGSPRQRRMMFGQRQTGNFGEISTEDIYIPDSDKKATRDQMRDTIRKRLEKNLPDSYGKEIRKYYEKLMDQ